jgi:acyl-CoA thioesterase-1
VKRLAGILLATLLGLAALIVGEGCWAAHGAVAAFQNPDGAPVQLHGEGTPRVYLVLGDSTGAGRGAPPPDGIAPGTARHLAERGPVTLINVSISGARMHDVRTDQLPRVRGLKPDVVLIAAGANDVAHFTSRSSVLLDLREIILAMRAANPRVRIVLTGSPQMGSVPRFPFPLNKLAQARTDYFNAGFDTLAAEQHVLRAQVAEETGPAFAADPTLFDEDQYHPNARGYLLWIRVLDEALDRTN